MKLLLVEDERTLSDSIKENLRAAHFTVDQAFDGAEGLFMAAQNIYEIIILDIMLPELSGYEVLTELRRTGVQTPVLLLTAKDGLDDKIKGFERGADDYLVKPFHKEELLMRLEAILRRSGGGLPGENLKFGKLMLNTQRRSAVYDGREADLPGKQYELFEYLLRNPSRILTKDQIFDRIWGFDSPTGSNVVEVYASNLRKTLKSIGADHYIRTVRGVGYILTEQEGE